MDTQLIEKLQKDTVNVLFTKKDGTERKMLCTLNSSFIPDNKKPKTERPIDVSKEVIAVFDTEKQDWQSINVSKIISFS